MFAKQLIKPFHVAIATGLLSTAFAAVPAHAEDPAIHTPSVMNQTNSVYQESLKFYLHPARLEVTETPRPMMDHPAVIVARRSPAGFDWTSAFILNPARLAVAPEASSPATDQPDVTVAKAKPVQHIYKTQFIASTPGK